MAYSKDEPMVSKPNAKYEHLYVIERWDPDVPEPENAIAVTKAFTKDPTWGGVSGWDLLPVVGTLRAGWDAYHTCFK
jgi:hypothetical protein